MNGEGSVDDVNIDDIGAGGTKARMAAARMAKREMRRYIMVRTNRYHRRHHHQYVGVCEERVRLCLSIRLSLEARGGLAKRKCARSDRTAPC